MERKQYEYLDQEREMLWAAVEELRNFSEERGQDIANLKSDIKKKTSDYEDEAKNSARHAASCKTQASNILKEAKKKRDELNVFFNNIEAFKETIPEINKLYESVKEKDSKILDIQKNIQNYSSEIIEKQKATILELEEAETSLSDAQTASEKINEVKEEIDALSQKTTFAHAQAVKKNADIKGLHNEIFGYTYENKETGEEEIVSGTKEELEQAYKELDDKKEKISIELDEFKETIKENHDDFFASKNKEIGELKTKIRSLLPEAMTAGLSHAYEKKRKNEEESLTKAKKTFGWAIFWLSATSLIPIAISAYLVGSGKTINDIILDLPRIVFTILPIYMPLFWFAMSANKSVKLSKRLIEEYSHKESLSKTFEGLSTQINNLEDDKISKDLRIRLLYNIISANSENPGKLIKDFHTSDNPILNVLDQSLSFSKSLEKLSVIPGVELVLKKVIKKQRARKEVIENSLGESFTVNEEIESYDEEAEDEDA